MRDRPANNAAPSESFIKRTNEVISSLFSIGTKLLILVLISIFLVGIYYEWRSDAFFIDKVEVPVEISDAGYDEEFITNRLLGAIQAIGIQARSKSDYSQYISTVQTPEIKTEPVGMGLSLDQLADYVSHFFGKERNYIRCQLVKSNTDLHIYLQIKDQPIIEVKEDANNLDQAIDRSVHKAAIQILKISHPITLAYYFFRTRQFNNATKAANLTLQSHGLDAKWAYNLIGTILNEQKSYDSAISPLEKALAIDNNFLSALNNLGIAHFNSLKPHSDSLAITYFSKCIKADTSHSYKFASYMLGRVWTRIGSYDSAIYCYRRSISIDPSYLLAYNNLGFTYCRKGRSNPTYYDSALRTLHHALTLPAAQQDQALLWTTIGEVMYFKGDTTAFYNCIEKAARLGYGFSSIVLTAEPYIHFKHDMRFQKIIKMKQHYETDPIH